MRAWLLVATATRSAMSVRLVASPQGSERIHIGNALAPNLRLFFLQCMAVGVNAHFSYGIQQKHYGWSQ